MTDDPAITLEPGRLCDAAVRRGTPPEAPLRSARAVMEEMEPSVILHRILDEAAKVARTPHVKILLVDGTTGVARVAAWKGTPVPPGFEAPLGRSYPGRVVVTGKPVFVADTQNDPDNILQEQDRQLGIRTFLGLPVKAGDEILGILTFNTEEPREYGRQELAFLAAFADQAALAVQHARLSESLEKRLTRQRTLARLNRLVSASLDRDEVLREITRAAGELMNASLTILWLLEDHGNHLDAVVFSDPLLGAAFPVRRLRIGEGAVGWVAERGERLLIQDLDADERANERQWWRSQGFTSALAVPLVADGVVLGVLALVGRQPFHLDAADDDLLDSFLGQIAVALRNARLYAESETGRRAAEAFAEVGRALSQTGDPDVVTQRVVESVGTLFGTGLAAFYRLEAGSGDLVVVAGANPQARELVGDVYPKGTGAVGLAVRRREPVQTPDVLADRRFSHVARQRRRLQEVFGHVAVLAVPLVVQDTVTGALAIGAEAGRVFSPEEVRLAQTFADQAALALESAQLSRRAAERAERLRTLCWLTQDITAAADAHTVFRAVAAAAVKLLGAMGARVWLDDPESSGLHLEAQSWAEHAQVPATIDKEFNPYGQGLIGRVMTGQEPIFLVPSLASQADMRVWAGIPMIARGKPVGALSMLFAERGAFTEEEQELMRLLADQAAIAISMRRDADLLRRLRDRTERLLASVAWILIAVDESDRITQWNAAAEEAFGRGAAETLGRPLTDAGIPWDWSAMLAHIAEGRRTSTPRRLDDVHYRRADGTDGLLVATITPLRGDEQGGFVLLGSDITERRILESQLAQARKLESIGQLAAGVAHEINTPIQFVGDNTRFLQTTFDDLQRLLAAYRRLRDAVATGEAVGARLEDVDRLEQAVDIGYLVDEIPRATAQTLDGVTRVATIVRALKTFAHPDQKDMVPVDINQALASTLVVARSEVKYVADVVTELADLPMVTCLPGEMNQVFLNLITNAAHAIADVVAGTEHRGTIRVTTARDGSDVVVTVSDTGTGIPEAIRDRIFDPFFTTKPVGRGTGQGLALARSVVVDQHGGRLSFETAPGRGTTFTVRLPIVGARRGTESPS
jgi:PAS domain S-box-containing protein